MDRNKYHLFNTTMLTIARNSSKVFDCAELTLINQGTQSVTINAVLTLNPGQSITFPAYPGEMNTQAYDFVFPNMRAAGCNLVAVTKNFVTDVK